MSILNAFANNEGSWLLDALTGSYLEKTLPLECIRVLAGFGPKKGEHLLKRSLLHPPESLQKKVFPWIEDGMKEVEEMIRTKGSEHSGRSFLKTLSFFRVVILQDACFYLENNQYSSHPIFSSNLFQDQEFLEYKRQLLSLAYENELPESLALKRVRILDFFLFCLKIIHLLGQTN